MVLEVQDPGVEKKFALGSYPEVSLAAARKARDAFERHEDLRRS